MKSRLFIGLVVGLVFSTGLASETQRGREDNRDSPAAGVTIAAVCG